MALVERSARRVAVLLPDLRAGGAERVHLELAKSWQKDGVITEFVVRQERGELLDQLPQSSTVFSLGAPRVRNALLPLIRYLKVRKPHALIAAMWPLTVIAPIAAKLAGFKGRVIISEHSPLSVAYANRGSLHKKVMGCSQRVAYPLANARIAVSNGVSEDISSSSGLAEDFFDVIYNPAASGHADTSAPRPISLKEQNGPAILSVGTLKAVKRHDLLLEAFARLPDTLGAELWLVGDGECREAIVDKAQRLGIQKRVVMPGFVADPGPWYAHADVFVLSSDYEGFGNVIVEAMDYGTPVVSTDCPVGPREILEGGKYGKLVPPNDPSRLAEAILSALGEDVDRNELRARAQDFASDSVARKYLAMLFPTVGRSKEDGQRTQGDGS